MTDYTEVVVGLSQGAEFIRGFGLYGDHAKYSFYTLGRGSSTLPKPVTTKSYFLNYDAEARLIERLGSFVSLVDEGVQLNKTRLVPSDIPITNPDELKTQLGWDSFGAIIDSSEQGLQAYLRPNAKKMPQFVLAQAFGQGVTADILRLSATTICPNDARNIFDALKHAIDSDGQ